MLQLQYLTSQCELFHTLLGIQLNWAMLCFCFVQSFMFYEGYNIDSKASAVNIRVEKKKKSLYTFTQQLHAKI